MSEHGGDDKSLETVDAEGEESSLDELDSVVGIFSDAWDGMLMAGSICRSAAGLISTLVFMYVELEMP
jgi:hypothetical protein